jgi:hypothetical protein
MIKLTYTLNEVDGIVRTEDNAHIIVVMESAGRDLAGSIIEPVKSMIDQGDIWFMHDELINDNLGINIVWILDSQSALDRFNSTAKLGLDTIGGTFAHEEIEFADFANYAAENSESTFNRYMLTYFSPA